MKTAHALVDRLLEAETPDPGQPPARQVPHASHSKWAGARGTFRNLYALKLKAMELMREMGYSIDYNHALAELGYTREEVAGPINAESVGSTDNLPPNHPARKFFRTFAKRFPLAIVGARLPEGGVLFFNNPVSRSPDIAVPTYEEYAKKLAAIAAERGEGYSWGDNTIRRQ